VATGATGVRFEATLESGDTEVMSWLVDPDGQTRGAYYVEVRYLGR